MSTTINAYNVSLGMDASKYLTNAGLSRSETVKLAQAIEQARSPAERYENALERLTKAKATGAIQTGTFIRLMDEEKRKLDEASVSAQKHVNSMDSLTTKVKQLVAAYVGMQTVTKSVNLAVAAEQAVVKFEILTGSVNDARLMMKQVQDFAVISPVTLAGAQNAAAMMLSFGIAAKDVQRNLKMIGDISGGNQERFDRLVYVFSQMSVAGRLMGQDLKQMVEAGFNPLKIMSDETGLSIEALRDKMEAGEISAQMVTDAFVRATSEGGRFHGMTERMAETMGGKLAIATANLDLALTNLGKSLGPLIISLTEGTDKGTSAVDRMSAAVGVWADGMGMVVAFTNDVFSGNAAWGSRDFLKNTETYMDMLEKRAIEIAKAKENIATEFSAPDAVGLLHGPTFDKEIQAEIEKENKVAHKAWEDMIDRVNKEEEKRINLERKLGREALKNAEEYFKKERDNARRLRDDIAKGPTSIEAGSAEAAKYMAEQANAAIAASMGLDKAVPTEEELLVEAQRQSELLEKSQENEDRMVELLRGILDKKPEVGRIR